MIYWGYTGTLILTVQYDIDRVLYADIYAQFARLVSFVYWIVDWFGNEKVQMSQ